MQAPQRESYDTVVIGAGVIGLACAWKAAARGMSVLVADRAQPGAGASGVAAGMLAPVTEADFGEEELLRLNLAGRARWDGFATELALSSGRDPGYVDSGALVVAADRDDAEELRRLHSHQRSLGLDAEWLAPSAARRLEPGLSPRVAGAILTPHDAHADPHAVVTALWAAVERSGGEVGAGLSVERVELERGRVTGVEAGGVHVRAPSVVVATGAWSARSGLLPDELRPPVRPVKGQILELKARAGDPPPADRVVRTPRCYVVSRPDGRVAVGATMEERGFDTAVTAGGIFRLLEAAREVLPAVEELELVAARSSLRPGTPDNLPVVGRGEAEGLVWATGHWRNGVLLAPLTADTVADLLEGGGPGPFEACAPARFVATAGAR